MTRKDYELIATVLNVDLTEKFVMLKSNSPHLNREELESQIEAIIVLTDRLARELKRDNNAFNYDKFMNASGVLNNPHNPDSGAYISI